MKLSILCEAAGIACPPKERDREITAIVSRSQEIVKGCLFVCIKGLHTDGHALASSAILGGAACVLVEDGASFAQSLNGLYFSVPSTRRALSLLCNAWYGFPTKKLRIVGVTGTNGKTTVTHMLRAILETDSRRCGIIGTLGCESNGRRLFHHGSDPLANMTTPDPEELYRILAEMVSDGVEYVLMEASSHALALEKTAPITFEAAIFTNLTPEHLDFHGSMEAYAEAKARLFASSRLSVINLDSPWAERMIQSANGKIVTCSIEARDADYVATELSLHPQNGAFYRLRSSTISSPIHCPMSGAFCVVNSMQAAICAMELGVDPKTVARGLSQFCGVKGRMEEVALGKGTDFRAFIDYAHTPDALETLLKSARRMQEDAGRVILVFGCGGDRDRKKRPVMGRIATSLADFTVITSDNCRSEDPLAIIGEILEGIDRNASFAVIPRREEAVRFAVAEARSGDLILLAGKGHEEYEITREGRRPFCEKTLIKDALKERLGGRENSDVTESEL